MDDRLTPLIEIYVNLEIRVQELMRTRCAEHCRKCPTVCCRIDYCQESLESPFLARVRLQAGQNPQWHPERGWLGNRGCTLRAGRPPVCYAFCCNTILAAQPTAFDRYAVDLLAMLMTFAGRRARGDRHLVELGNLSALNIRRITHQLQTADRVLDQLLRYWSAGDAPSMEWCRKIRPFRQDRMLTCGRRPALPGAS